MRKIISISLGLVGSIILSVLLAVPAVYAAPAGSPSGAPTGEISWTVGQPFPKDVHGRALYPTGPKPKPPRAQTHWYAGGVDPSSAQQDAESISTTITIPGKDENPSDFYYVILSAWDSHGSYDQIGFSADYGAWGLSYSWTSANGHKYHYSPDAYSLNYGATYTFTITTSGGVTTFAASTGGKQVWSLNANTGGNYLILSYSYSLYYNYTDYEEIWQTATKGGVPSFDFVFNPNTWTPPGGASTTWTDWTTFETSGTPSAVSVGINGTSITVKN